MTAGVDEHRGTVDEPDAVTTAEAMGGSTGNTDVVGDLWIDWYASRTGMYRLLSLLGVEDETRQRRYGPYAFVVVLIFVLGVGFPAVRYVQTGSFPVLESPGLLVMLPAWLFIVYVIRGLAQRYETVTGALPEPDDVGDSGGQHYRGLLTAVGVPLDGAATFQHPVPATLKRFLLVPGVGLHLAWFVLDPSPMSWLRTIWGPELAWVFFGIIVPFVFFVIGVELVSLYLGVHVFLPLTVTARDHIDFTDPHLYGGLRSVGRLLRDSAASMLVLLSLYFVFESVSMGTSPFDAFSRIILFGGIGFAVCTFLGPVYWLHLYMRRKKEAKIEEITDEIEMEGPDGARFPDIDPKTDEFEFYTNEFIRLNRVENMKEFPIDFSLVVEFIFVLLLPYLAHVSSIFVFEKLLH